MNLRKKVNKDNVFVNYVNILNGVLQLSKREAEVFSLMLRFNEETDSEDLDFSYIRKVIVDALGISEANLSRYLTTLKQKNLLIKNGNTWLVNDTLVPDLDHDVIEVTFTLDIVNEEINSKDSSVEDYNKVESDLAE